MVASLLAIVSFNLFISSSVLVLSSVFRVSTTLASLINEISMKDSKHVITIEDPIEYVFTSKKSIISQRQVVVDTASFADGIKYSLRQDPDVIFIGEIRDKETMESPVIKNLYPAGEGSGYSGGIVSSAMDGENVAKKISEN